MSLAGIGGLTPPDRSVKTGREMIFIHPDDPRLADEEHSPEKNWLNGLADCQLGRCSDDAFEQVKMIMRDDTALDFQSMMLIRAMDGYNVEDMQDLYAQAEAEGRPIDINYQGTCFARSALHCAVRQALDATGLKKVTQGSCGCFYGCSNRLWLSLGRGITGASWQVEWLLSLGADPNVRDFYNNKCLKAAKACPDPEMRAILVEMLEAHGATD